MPEAILYAYFRSRGCEPPSSGEGRQSSVTAHLAAMTCQRLLAYHSARNTVYGQHQIVRLIRLLRKRDGRPAFTWEPATYFDSVVNGPLVVASGKPEVWLQCFVPETRKVLATADTGQGANEA